MAPPARSTCCSTAPSGARGGADLGGCDGRPTGARGPVNNGVQSGTVIRTTAKSSRTAPGWLRPGITAMTHPSCTADDFYVFAVASGNLTRCTCPAGRGQRSVDRGPSPRRCGSGSLISAVLGGLLPGIGALLPEPRIPRPRHARRRPRRPGDRARQERERHGPARYAGPSGRRTATIVRARRWCSRRGRNTGSTMSTCRARRPAPPAFRRADQAGRKPAGDRRGGGRPEEPNALGGALLAARRGLIVPITVGARFLIRRRPPARSARTSPGSRSSTSPNTLPQLTPRWISVVAGRAGADEGDLHTDELLRAALRKEQAARRRRFTHVFVMDVPGLSHLLVTDAAINIAPTSPRRQTSCRTPSTSPSLGIEEPKVERAVRGRDRQPGDPLVGGRDAALEDGRTRTDQRRSRRRPLSRWTTPSISARRGPKGIVSPRRRPGRVLVVPDLDAGNMLAKQLAYLSRPKARAS